MKLRKKMVIFISVVALSGLGVTYLLLHLILLNHFNKLDDAALRQKLNDTVYAFQNELQTMEAKVQILSYTSNYDESIYQNNRLDMLALLSSSGQTLYGGIYSQRTETVSALTPELLELFSRIHSTQPLQSGEKEGRSGVVLLDAGPMLITLMPVAAKDNDTPLGGTAIAGRMLRQDELTRIGLASLSGIRLAPVSPAQLAESGGRDTWITVAPENLKSIYTRIDDLFGNPGLVISIQQPRQIYQSGLQAVQRFRLFFFAVTLLMCLASLLFVNRSILRRMASLVSNIRIIGSSQDLSIRINSSGQDEFSQVEHEFNRMISSLEQAQDELRQQSTLDPLTRLPNRSLFFAKLSEVIEEARVYGRQIALVFIDLDHFKTVNDTLGHDFGDTLLKETADRITKTVGQRDIVSRLGGDEFTILLADIPDAEDLAVQLSRIQNALLAPHLIHGHLLYNTASIGVSIYPQNGEDADVLVKQADLAMFHVKESGRNNIFQYSEALEESVRRKKILAQELLSAADNHEFEVHYQPILSSDSLKVSKVEALLRWTSPIYGSVPPAEFIPVAEASGSIVGIGNWVLRQVCSDLHSFRNRGLELSAAVNISAMQLMQPGLLATLLELQDEYGLPSSCLELEITESILVSGDSIFQSLQQLRERGFRISLDDFGTGFSSLSYLRRFPVDVIKIDRSFVSEMTPDPQGDVLVKAIIELSHNLGLRVVSEGIEHQEQFDKLRLLGSDELQGYYISRPLRSQDIPAFLSQDSLFHSK